MSTPHNEVGEPTSAWCPAEITLTAEREYDRPYADVAVWAEFTHTSGKVVRRPAFWDGGSTWRLRFAAPLTGGRWTWRSSSSSADPGLAGQRGELTVSERPDESNRFRRHGFWRMSPAGRNLVHTDGTPALLVADTAWALPWRATEEDVRIYAADRRAKGFNAVLLMSVQPDMGVRGPRDRTADGGFGVAFEDLPDGHLSELNPGYFQYLDRLLGILAEHEIVPVLQPVFQGYGWKGQKAAGTVVPPEEYARYCRYLVARYGASPAVWLVGADGSGEDPQTAAGGEEIERWDGYGQPCGIHYRPYASNRVHQAARWLDFQWCQTGHRGEHAPERLTDMWRNGPAKGVANGEPTYENSGERGKGAGWWQGHEAWSNLCAGGTMGVVYGAGSLWQWRLHPDEPGHEPFFLADGAGWREALDFEGSRYVGLVARILEGLPTTDMRPSWEVSLSPRGLLVPGVLYVAYGEHGGPLGIRDLTGRQVPRSYRVVDPRTGEITGKGVRTADVEYIPDDGGAPRIYICHDG
ncbi:apiosidase-like domain-containing protein [Streptomyces sp. NBC_00459]|uniref:apiosidase-like domain-containing protein n=1 Tax=Streptomyces sp. NBC_00459 TaxID=2975749 RepID=UPI002E1821A1